MSPVERWSWAYLNENAFALLLKQKCKLGEGVHLRMGGFLSVAGGGGVPRRGGGGLCSVRCS